MSTTLAGILLGVLGFQELILLFLIIIILLPVIFFLITVQNTFNAVSPENRKMDGGLVWLTLIPLFGLVWQFIIVNRMADSLKLEFAKRNISTNEARPGINLGLAFCILFCCSIIPFVNIITSIAGLVCWIMYWVKINEYKSKLSTPLL
ncbi:MAG: hypothetical protein ACK52I_27055 [Pseudomonadota bacterium]